MNPRVVYLQKGSIGELEYILFYIYLRSIYHFEVRP